MRRQTFLAEFILDPPLVYCYQDPGHASGTWLLWPWVWRPELCNAPHDREDRCMDAEEVGLCVEGSGGLPKIKPMCLVLRFLARSYVPGSITLLGRIKECRSPAKTSSEALTATLLYDQVLPVFLKALAGGMPWRVRS